MKSITENIWSWVWNVKYKTLFFSGSIYAITFGVNAKNIWFITPIGGLLFIIGWLKIALSFNKNK